MQIIRRYERHEQKETAHVSVNVYNLSWRPFFVLYHVKFSLVSFLSCPVMNFVIMNPYFKDSVYFSRCYIWIFYSLADNCFFDSSYNFFSIPAALRDICPCQLHHHVSFPILLRSIHSYGVLHREYHYHFIAKHFFNRTSNFVNHYMFRNPKFINTCLSFCF